MSKRYTSSPAALITVFLLHFTYGLDSQINVVQGERFTLSCDLKVSADEALSWRQIKNDSVHLIAVGDNILTPDERYGTVRGNKLELRDARLRDSGTYQCFIGEEPYQQKQTFTVNVQQEGVPGVPALVDSRRIPLRFFMPKYAFRGQRVETDCQFEVDSDQLYSIKWYKDNIELARYVAGITAQKDRYQFEDPRVVKIVVGTSENGTTTAMLQLTVNGSSSGKYRCEIAEEAPSFRTEFEETVMIVVENASELSQLKTSTESPGLVNGAGTQWNDSLEAHLNNLQMLFQTEKQILSRQLEILETEHLLRKKLLISQAEYYKSLKESVQRS